MSLQAFEPLTPARTCQARTRWTSSGSATRTSSVRKTTTTSWTSRPKTSPPTPSRTTPTTSRSTTSGTSSSSTTSTSSARKTSRQHQLSRPSPRHRHLGVAMGGRFVGHQGTGALSAEIAGQDNEPVSLKRVPCGGGKAVPCPWGTFVLIALWACAC